MARKRRVEANPFKEMPSILYPDELMDKAYLRAEKLAGELRTTTRGLSTPKSRIIEDNKIRVISSVLSDNLIKIVEKTPSVDNLQPFYREILEIMVGSDEFKKSLAAIQWASDIIRRLGIQYSRRAKKAKSPQDASFYRKQFVGRVSSIIKQIYPNLAFLGVAQNKLKNIPTVKDLPSIVIAGYPNVGKSTLLRTLTGAEPEVNTYPFTTKGLNIGYTEEGIQVVDTPGVLDRPIYERNDIELHAVIAINYLSDALIYVIDPTEHCGFTVDAQMSLLKEVEKTFSVPVIVAMTKSDLENVDMDEDKIARIEDMEKELEDFNVVKVSSISKEGIESLKFEILETIDKIGLSELIEQ
ncbi:NOG1 family protein [Methanococcus voltae]|uniref:Nucleolar GTP-binding protein n=2 Tax=Methanococcus voltae TaxID=2188 RepID=A0A8J7RGG8_METVO|nr:GTPase [Methanococcus voltae]MBP2171960.1 nucleolar GTP-binding protein [Methanococcus voltae]MBP2201085.1 nucleolar GTP-binding protein [Methanococcus voltae]MCS3921808.1 nucleolar GTP-binding protein [Methanococcus voltae PS]